jgi:transcriptional regulator with XRE-family HTH domain
MQNDKLLIAIGTRVKQLRKSKGFSQENFALEAGLDRSFYGHFERGSRNISILNLIKIAVALRLEVGELFPELKDILPIVQNK